MSNGLKLRREFVRFRNRPDRPKFIGKRFQSYLTGHVLDIGCDQAILKDLLGKYTGVGMSAESDVRVDLERTAHLPFRNTSCNTVLCLDTLEHLNNLHEFYKELFRIAQNHVIISLPNCWSQARRSIACGKGSVWHYGLPLTTPPDRHKWFFNTEEACAFLTGIASASQKEFEVSELVLLENRRPWINRFWRRIKYPSRTKYFNLYTNTIVCVYTRRS